MKTKNYYAVKITTEKDGEHFCSQIGKGLYFFVKDKKGKDTPVPTLFPTKKAAKKAIETAVKTYKARSKKPTVVFDKEIGYTRMYIKKVALQTV